MGDLIQVKVISESFVKPHSVVEATKQHFHLGPNELVALSMNYLERGMIFTFHHDHQSSSSNIDIQIFLEKLKHSLSLCLVHFTPLAGRLATQKFPDEHASLIYVDCAKGPGAKILHATLDLHVSDILSPDGHVSTAVRSLFDLDEMTINHDGHTQPLLSIQVTELLDGVFLGFSMNHAIVDGVSFTRFTLTLSEIFLGQTGSDTILRKPIFKPFFPDGYGPTLKLPYLEPEEFVTRPKDQGPLRERIFHFSQATVAELKAKANQECGVHNISSFKAMAAFLWRFITRARHPKQDDDQVTTCILIVNARTRIEPPLSEDYFGNFVSGAASWCTVGELLGHQSGWAARMIHESVVGQNDKKIRGHLESWIKTTFVAKRRSLPMGITIGGSTKFDMYGPEFGFGRALGVVTGPTNRRDGKVTAKPGREVGSVDMQIVLSPQTMDALESDDEFMSYVS